jgi:glucosamine-6-phosphate deaminase
MGISVHQNENKTVVDERTAAAVEHPEHVDDLTPAMLAMPADRLAAVSQYPLYILPTKTALYEWIARLMADEIKERNTRGEPTRWILPLGPKGQYPILARITNEERIDWRNVHAFHMDEWLDWQGRPVPYDHPFSLRAFADQHLYDRIDSALRPPPQQIVFPSIYDIDAYSNLIEQVGGIDTTFAGFGYRGHLAFNETPCNRWQRISIEELAAGKTRIVHLLEDSIIAHSQRATGGYTQCIPQMAVTVGMADMLASRRIWLLTDGGPWKQWMLRVFLLTKEKTAELPMTLCHGHPDVRVAVDADSAAPLSSRFGRDPN